MDLSDPLASGPNTCNDLQTIVNAHNKYFVEVGPRLANNISSSINPMSYLTNHVDNSMEYFRTASN